MPSRRGDAISIPGDYQLRASQSPNAVQRFWHAAKKLAIDQMLPPQSGERIIDAGCGSGVIADYLAASGADVTAIDANPEAIRFAISAFQRPNLRFRSGFVNEDLHLDAPVDKIYSLEVIEHMYEPEGAAMLQNFFSGLRPGGRCLLTTPNYFSTIGLWRLYLPLRGRRFSECGQPINQFTLIPRTMTWLRRAGLRVTAVDAIGHYLPFPGRPPIHLPRLDNPRSVMKWIAHHSFVAAIKQ